MKQLFTLIVIYFLICKTFVLAQNVNVSQFEPLQNQLKLSDIWNISISNFDTSPYRVRAKINVKFNNSEDALNAETGNFTISQGTRNYQGRLLEPINYSFINDKIINSIRRTATLPDGDYTICIDIINQDNLQILSSSCIEHSVATAIPPALFAPYDGTDMYDNIIVWSWFMQPETSSGEKVVCDLTVVELLEGQTGEEAIKLNPPVVFRPNLTTATWQSNFAMRSLRSGKRYAWKVVAKAGGKVVNESEIWQFTYNNEYAEDTVEETNIKKAPDEYPLNNVENEKKLLSLSGKFRLTLENSNNQSLLSKTPKQYARFEAEPVITLLGVPIGLNFLLTSEENTKKYNMNRGAFNYESGAGGLGFSISQRIEDRIESITQQIDSASIDSLKNLSFADSIAFENRIAALYELQNENFEDNMQTLKEFGLISEEQEIIAQFPAFGFGKIAPAFSTLFMNGVSITGGLIEYNPGNFYTGTAFGKIQNEVNLSSIEFNPLLSEQGLDNPEFFKNMYSGRIGYGRRNGSNIILSALYASDDDQSKLIKNVLDSTGSILGIEDNTVLGMSGRYLNDEIGLSFSGEFNTSVYNQNTNAGVADVAYVNPLIKDIFGDNIKNGALADVSYNLNVAYTMDDDTRFQSTIRFIGPGYKSVGIAGIRQDLMIYDLHFFRNFVNNKIRFSAFLSNEESGYVLSDLNNSKINKIGSKLDFRFRSLPVISLNYVGNIQKLKLFGSDIIDNNSIHQFTVNSSYAYQVGYTRMLSFLSYSFQKGESNDSAATFDTHIFMATHRISLFDKFAAGLSGSYTESKNLLEAKSIPVYSVDFSLLHNVENLITTSLGFNYNYTQTGNLKSLYFNSRITFNEHFETDVRVEARYFGSDNNPKSAFNETVARLITIFTL